MLSSIYSEILENNILYSILLASLYFPKEIVS